MELNSVNENTSEMNSLSLEGNEIDSIGERVIDFGGSERRNKIDILDKKVEFKMIAAVDNIISELHNSKTNPEASTESDEAAFTPADVGRVETEDEAQNKSDEMIDGNESGPELDDLSLNEKDENESGESLKTVSENEASSDRIQYSLRRKRRNDATISSREQSASAEEQKTDSRAEGTGQSNLKNYPNPFEVVVPLIGQRAFPAVIQKPFTQRYDLARERNRLRALDQKDECNLVTSFPEYRRRRESRTPEEVQRDLNNDRIRAMEKAHYLTKIAIKILRELKKDEVDEDCVIKYFDKFMNVPVSSLSLVFAPHLVHTVMYCRGCTDFSLRLRKMANECYCKCHVMFPIPDGYNFETVFTSEVKKYMPDELSGMEINQVVADYGDYDSPSSDSEDSAFCEDSMSSNAPGK